MPSSTHKMVRSCNQSFLLIFSEVLIASNRHFKWSLRVVTASKGNFHVLLRPLDTITKKSQCRFCIDTKTTSALNCLLFSILQIHLHIYLLCHSILGY